MYGYRGGDDGYRLSGAGFVKHFFCKQVLKGQIITGYFIADFNGGGNEYGYSYNQW